MAQKSYCRFRHWTAGLLVCALIIQGMMLALAGARIAADSTSDTYFSGFEICRHGGSAPTDPASDKSDGHCIFCLAAAAFAAHAPPPLVEFTRIAHALAPFTFARWRLPSLTVEATALARGPPPAA